jgi:hypothetical protein
MGEAGGEGLNAMWEPIESALDLLQQAGAD